MPLRRSQQPIPEADRVFEESTVDWKIWEVRGNKLAAYPILDAPNAQHHIGVAFVVSIDGREFPQFVGNHVVLADVIGIDRAVPAVESPVAACGFASVCADALLVNSHSFSVTERAVNCKLQLSLPA